MKKATVHTIAKLQNLKIQKSQLNKVKGGDDATTYVTEDVVDG